LVSGGGDSIDDSTIVVCEENFLEMKWCGSKSRRGNGETSINIKRL
jgi:hypothetical protein